MEIHAYDKAYLKNAMRGMGEMLDYAVNGLGFGLEEFYAMFLDSELSVLFAAGDVRVIAGMSGPELALEITELEPLKTDFTVGKSEEYWTGWALAYYQWEKNISFQKIEEIVPIAEVRMLYHPYHEMDVTKFAERIEECYRKACPDSRLKSMRKKRGFTQRQLAGLSGVPLRTIQQYEQRQKDIKKAQAISVASLARELGCKMEDILE